MRKNDFKIVLTGKIPFSFTKMKREWVHVASADSLIEWNLEVETKSHLWGIH